ncbi:chemotaxis-specific protein-glutamate methyltransferase CheB [Burkholderiaceae bacterium DAT-1]|nr:chemotaxis-specific protein-glutamate methyltransferase CheB [Burkholderiaceae bacterium DAT-1]
MIRLLIVDDSALMRRQLSQVFQAEGDFEIRMARNGREAVNENRDFQPDVVTLDINMPEMDGLTALSLIMAERAVPVVMVSSLTEKGALATFEALNLGAVDYVAKPGGTISLSIDDIRQEMISKVRAACKARLKQASQAKGLTRRIREDREKAVKQPPVFRRGAQGEGVVLIGVSTGGPRTLEEILPELDPALPWPVLVAQHMPAAFTRSFAERLNAVCELNVLEVAGPMEIECGNIYIAKGGADMVVVQRGARLSVIPRPEAKEYIWHPSVELLARSALEHFDPARIIGVMLTGMGYDGADAFTDIRKRGGRTIAESAETAVVFGMPAELIERGGASVTLPMQKIAVQINHWAGR